MIDQINSMVNLSQFEMSGWEFIPGALLILFLAGGCAQIVKARSNDLSPYREKRKSSQRRRIDMPMTIDTPVTQPFSVKTYDISVTGAFIPLCEMKKSMNFTSLIGKRSGIKVGDIIDLKLQTGRFSQINCQGRVVRLGQAGDQPEGIGIKFLEMRRKDQKRLESLLAHHDLKDLAS